MLKRIIMIICLVISSIVLIDNVLIDGALVAKELPVNTPETSAQANWQVTDQKVQKLFSTDSSGNRFSLVQGDNGVDFVLLLSNPIPQGASPNRIHLVIDSSQPLTTDVQFIRQSDTQIQLTLVLDTDTKKQLMKQMMGGLELRLIIKETNKKIASLNYSLMGFTANLNDFLIAREIGRLNYHWLAGQNKHKELVCYYAANTYVQTLLDRKNGLTIENSLEKLPKSGILQLDEEIGPEIIRNVFKLSDNKIPIEPRGDKYAIFANCISR